MLKCKVYLSDEGFGHLVRQEAIIKSMLRLNNKIHFTIQTKNKSFTLIGRGFVRKYFQI